MEELVLLKCNAKLCISVASHSRGFTAPPFPPQLSWQKTMHCSACSASDWYRIVAKPEEEKIRRLIVHNENEENPKMWKTTGGMEMNDC